MNTFGAIDIVITAATFLATMIMGGIMTRQAYKCIARHFLGGRSIPFKANSHAFSLMAGLCSLLTVESMAAVNSANGKTDYHGSNLSEIQLQDQRVAQLLTPKAPLPGKPWILAPRLYDIDNPEVSEVAKTQILLAKKGIAILAVAPSANLDNASSQHLWDQAYQLMTQEHGFSVETGLMGVGKEADAAVRWIVANASKVSGLYLDRGIFDFNDAKLAEKLASSRIGALYVAGENDEVAPPASYGKALESLFHEKGYPFQIILEKGKSHTPYGTNQAENIVRFFYGQIYRDGMPSQKAVAYGPHCRQFLDFYQAKSATPTPVIIYIHGGSWQGSTLMDVGRVRDYLNAGISVVSVEYRFIRHAVQEKIVPPVRGPLYDAARAVQFVRSKSSEWNIRKDRVALTGFSAGACSSLWLAFHTDLADPSNPDPILRESTRPYCVAVSGAQTSLDPQQMKQWIPNIRYGAHAFGVGSNDPRKGTESFAEFLSKREELLPWINEYSPYALAKAGAPPVFMGYSHVPDFQKPPENPTHSANFGVKLQERLRELNVPCEVVYPGVTGVKYATISDFLLALLKQ